jgi:AcrR family transcriptional regulator
MTVDKRKEAQEKIVYATIECIEKFGLQNATIRNIGEMAGVNSSAISYYFGGRDGLIDQVWDITLNNAFDFSDMKINEDDDYKTVIKKILTDWYQGMINYPNICNAHFQGIICGTEQGKLVVRRMQSFIGEVYLRLIKHGMQDCDLKKNQLDIVFMSLFGNSAFNGANDDKDINGYIELLSQII